MQSKCEDVFLLVLLTETSLTFLYESSMLQTKVHVNLSSNDWHYYCFHLYQNYQQSAAFNRLPSAESNICPAPSRILLEPLGLKQSLGLVWGSAYLLKYAIITSYSSHSQG